MYEPNVRIGKKRTMKRELMFPIEVSRTLTYVSVKSSMMAERRKVQPPLPQTMTELAVSLEVAEVRNRFGSTKNGLNFYRLAVRDEDGGLHLLFISGNMEELVMESTIWSMDGTFRTRPASPPMRQIFFILCFRYDHAFPVVTVLMETRTASAYQAVFAELKRLYPNIAPRTVITDFERGLQHAVQTEFPTANIVGCLFHSTQSMVRKSSALGLKALQQRNMDGPVARVVRLCMALPCLPHAEIAPTLAEIVDYARRHNVYEILHEFFQYMDRQWIMGVQARHLSVWGQIRRTNNDHESFNHVLGQMIEHHGSLWSFMDRLRTVEDVYMRKLESARNSYAIARNPPRKYLLLDRNMKKAKAKLMRGRISSFEYVEYISNLMRTTHASGLNNNEEDLDELLVPPPDAIDDEHADSLASEESGDDDDDGDEDLNSGVGSRGATPSTTAHQPRGSLRGRGARGSRVMAAGRGARVRGARRGRGASLRSSTTRRNLRPTESGLGIRPRGPNAERDFDQMPTAEEMDVEERNRRVRCDICLLNPRDVLNMPCRHLISCRRCAEVVLASSHPWCGVCRQPFSILDLIWT